MAGPPRRTLTYTLAAVLAVTAAAGAIGSSLGEESATVVANRAATDLAAVCATDRGVADRAGADCLLAAEVAANGPPTATQVVTGRAGTAGDDGQPGADGAAGEDGRGIVSTRLEAGRLLVVYSDGQTRDVGPVVGEPGDPGVDGEAGQDGVDGDAGRGITGTTVADGRLLVTYTDGATADLGAVVGPAGRGIADLDGTSGRLLVTLTDGEVVDAGPLPPGPRGEPAPALAGQTFRFPDGSERVCDRVGGADTAPVMSCGDRTGAAPDPALEEG